MSNSNRILNLNRCAIAVAAWALAASSHAADESGMWYINPQYGWTLVDKERPVNNDDHVALGIGRHHLVDVEPGSQRTVGQVHQ